MGSEEDGMTRPLPLTERDFQRQVVELAHIHGWEDFHVRAGRTADSWRVPGSGTMAAGWPDLVLARDRTVLFVELKADTGKLTPAQERVLAILSKAATVHVWRPRDWMQIEFALSRNGSRNLEDGAVA